MQQQQPINPDYEGYNPLHVPKGLFQPSAYQNLSHITKHPDKPNTWSGSPVPHPSWGRTYGGVFLAQSLTAGYQLLTRDVQKNFYLSNQQSYWLRTGDQDLATLYMPVVLKGSKSYVMIRVDAYQKDVLVFTCLLTFVSFFEKNTHQHSFPTTAIDFTSLPDPKVLPLIGEEYLNIAKTLSQYDQGEGKKMSAAIAHSIHTSPYLIKTITPGEHAPEHYLVSNVERAKLPEKDNVKEFEAHVNDVRNGCFVHMNHLNPAQPTPPQRVPMKPMSLMYIRLPQGCYKMFNIPKPTSTDVIEVEQQRLQSPFNTDNTQPTSPIKRNPISLEMHLNILALLYVSDFMLIGQGLKPHYDIPGLPPNMQFSSLNHNFNLITPFFDIFNDWLVYHAAAPYLAYSKQQLLGAWYRRDGTPIAYVTQQAVARVFDPSEDLSQKFPNPANAKL